MRRWLGGIGLVLLCAGIVWEVRHPARLMPRLMISSQEQQTGQYAAADPQSDSIGPMSEQTDREPVEHRATVYLFLATGCPISNACIPTLNQLQDDFSSVGIRFVGVIPGEGTTPKEVETHRREYGVRFPVVRDRQNKLCGKLGATHTPQAVVVTADERIVYSGRIDDRFTDLGQKRFATTTEDLRFALNAVVAGRPVAVSHTEPIGCLIEDVKSPPAGQITFNRDVAPILFRRCVRCHRPQEVAPFSLLTYDDVCAHAKQIRLVVQRRLMPPWKAAPGFGHFRNERRMTVREIDTINQWVTQGLAEGNPADLPARPEFVPGWQLGKPDLELTMTESFSVPADGPDIYQHFIIPTGLMEDRLVSAVEFRPGASSVVHHSIMYFDTTGQGRLLDAKDPRPGYERLGTPGFPVSGSLGGWGPGGLPYRLPKGLGRPLLKNSDLVVQIHYHPSGKPVRDRSRIGIYFADKSATMAVTQVMVANVDLKIPAGAANHYHRAVYTLPVETILLDATPHMHVLGKEIKAVAHLPNGDTKPLIWIKNWDFYWQDTYVYVEPLRLPAGTRIELECWFDNSTANPLNPNSPPKTVSWGDFSTDEMAICYFQVTTERWDDYLTLSRHQSKYFERLWNRYQRHKHATATQNSRIGNR